LKLLVGTKSQNPLTTACASAALGRGFAMRIIAACAALAFFATGAMAENIVIDDPRIQYNYSFETLGSRHFCDFATVVAKAPMVIKLTAAFITDDAKPKNQDLTVAYIVEAFVAGVGKNSQLESKQVKVITGRIISDIFHSDLHASKNVDKDLGASYNITSEGSFALFTGLMTTGGPYILSVEFKDHSTITVNVKPTPEIFDASEKWNQCGIAIMEHQPPR
jgi:hypothetical protein